MPKRKTEGRNSELSQDGGLEKGGPEPEVLGMEHQWQPMVSDRHMELCCHEPLGHLSQPQAKKYVQTKMLDSRHESAHRRT